MNEKGVAWVTWIGFYRYKREGDRNKRKYCHKTLKAGKGKRLLRDILSSLSAQDLLLCRICQTLCLCNKIHAGIVADQ